jgi:hydrogenase maturation factor
VRLGAISERVLHGPNVGEDAAVIDMGEKVLVVATDPITGAVGNIGWLAVHVNANDVASTGAKPLWFLCVTLLPEGSGEDQLDGIMKQIQEALSEIDATLIGGHTEVTPGLDRPILIGLMMGEAPRNNYVSTGGALPGDQIILTKAAGIEGTAIFAEELYDILLDKIDPEKLESAKEMLKRISVVPESMNAIDTGGVNSLHDPTEGGLLNGLWEMAEAAEVGLLIDEKTIPIFEETRQICTVLDADPLKLMGSGSLIIVAEKKKSDNILKKLREIDINAVIIGEITNKEEGRVLIKKDGNHQKIKAVIQDEVYRILEKYDLL